MPAAPFPEKHQGTHHLPSRPFCGGSLARVTFRGGSTYIDTRPHGIGELVRFLVGHFAGGDVALRERFAGRLAAGVDTHFGVDVSQVALHGRLGIIRDSAISTSR
jgi:hypothetical protein